MLSLRSGVAAIARRSTVAKRTPQAKKPVRNFRTSAAAAIASSVKNYAKAGAGTYLFDKLPLCCPDVLESLPLRLDTHVHTVDSRSRPALTRMNLPYQFW